MPGTYSIIVDQLINAHARTCLRTLYVFDWNSYFTDEETEDQSCRIYPRSYSKDYTIF